jgi:hypothetical protein
MGGFSWLVRRPAAAGDQLTLSSPAKATLLWIILWRCSATAEHGIARQRAAAGASRDQQLPSMALLNVRLLHRPVWGWRADLRRSICNDQNAPILLKKSTFSRFRLNQCNNDSIIEQKSNQLIVDKSASERIFSQISPAEFFNTIRR